MLQGAPKNVNATAIYSQDHLYWERGLMLYCNFFNLGALKRERRLTFKSSTSRATCRADFFKFLTQVFPRGFWGLKSFWTLVVNILNSSMGHKSISNSGDCEWHKWMYLKFFPKLFLHLIYVIELTVTL